jgi:hypothetical protein
MRLDLSKMTRLFALALFTGALSLSLPMLIVSHGEAKAKPRASQWCVYIGDSTNRCYNSLRQCRLGTPGRNCVRGPS